MFDINTIINDAIAAAVAQAIQPLQQEYANKMAEMAEKIAVLENQAIVVSNTLDTRIAALETKLTEADLFTKTTEGHVNKDELLEYLDNQEWFWHKIRNFTDTVVEQAIENHTECWDHNDFFVTEDKLDDYVKTEDLDSEVRDAVRDIMEGATVSIRI